ncbi:MAG: adenosylcobinamide-phosphate synthase CbiB [Candidatus Sulfotelmatobacter sp.]
MEIDILRPHATLLAGAVLLDFLIGDPVYSAHPIRLIGRTLNWLEGLLRKLGADGYGGGIALFILLSTIWLGGTSAVLIGLQKWSHGAASFFHLFLAYSCLALHDLVRHAWAVETAARRGDLDGARTSISKLVGRDTDRMDIAACRRAAIESLSENLTDGFVSPLSWYVVAGLPGLVLFKVVSTMDSMVGYKTPRYLKFGWCGARLDDLMNFVPARITWIILTLFSFVIPGCSGRKAFRVGWQQHAILPGPNSGWSEAATAGGIQRRLLGPIWAKGALVTDVWLGDPSDPPAGADSDLPRAVILNVAAGVLSAALAILLALRI